ncbi:PREDICTED: cytochrome P450 20A1-like [Priapulus caudatus]|uniref:Cytochrome P450 20A1-like n=1 Tax=Priapulus caudatus TaxID=37621 RepID=A0ABM1ECD2_PRICU|nr:PREDICTED: cytochrome P450 20A1-like [Priapulus caudatus]
MDPADPKEGNLPDILQAGSLHEFLQELHDKYGPIASFWRGTQYTISIASPDLFKEQQHVFDRPANLYASLETLLTEKSIQFANGPSARHRRTMLDKYFTADSVATYYGTLHKLSKELSEKWASLPANQHIPLEQHMMALAVKMFLKVAYGFYFNDDRQVLAFKKNYDLAWHELESWVSGTTPEPGSEREKVFLDARDSMFALIEAAMKHREDHAPTSGGGDRLFLDVLRDPDNEMDADVRTADALTYAVGGMHTTGIALTWAIYFLASHEDIQEKLCKELKDQLGDSVMSPQEFSDSSYLRQVIDETLRCAIIGPHAARVQDFDSKLGGHIVPKNTPVIQALGVVMHDEKIWPEPNKFDPERFSSENSKGRSSYAFQPYGFAGKRICPGYRLANAEIGVALSELCRRFKFHLVAGQVVQPVHGLVTRPKDEVWITISKR